MLLCGAILISCAFWVFPVYAWVPGIIPFGGRSLAAVPCTCSGCVLVTVGPPRPGTFMYCPTTSRLYKWYTLTPPAWQLGIATGFRICEELCPLGCCPIGGGPVILKDGTSLY